MKQSTNQVTAKLTGERRRYALLSSRSSMVCLGRCDSDEHDRATDAEIVRLRYAGIPALYAPQAKSRGLVMALKQMIARLFLGKRFGWQGVDVFHFDANGKIKGKFTYGWYGSRPHIQRELG